MTNAKFCLLGCGARVIFARTEAGKKQPLDWVTNHEGNVAAYCDELGNWWARTLKDTTTMLAAHERRYMPHAATCPVIAARRGPPPAEVTDLDEWRQKIKTITPAKRRLSKRRRA